MRMLNKSRFLSTSATAFALCLIPHSVLAQQAATPTPAPPAASSDAGIQEIVVTAQKRSQSINRVGMAITALNSEQLQQKGVVSVSDLVKVEPSLQYAQSQSGTPVYTLRGVGYFEQSLSATPTVSIYQDEVAFAFPVMSRGVLLDPERVEILKGPQGTLYGQNATGGAINFIAAKPTDALTAGLDTSFARFNDYKAEGFISGPLSSTLKFRLAASTEGGGAWQRSVTRDDELGNKDTQIVRLILDWKPVERLKASLNLNGWRDRSDTQAAQLEGVRFQAPQNIGTGSVNDPAFYLPAAPGTAAYNGYPAVIQAALGEPVAPANARAADWVAGTRPRNDEKYYQAALRLDYELSDTIGITSLSNYAHFNENNLVDPTGNAYEAVQTDQIYGRVSSFSQELRLHGEVNGSKGHWLIGANYARDKSDEVDAVTTVGSVSFSPVGLGLPPYFHFGAINKDTAVTKSIFANADYQILETVNLHGGIRYTKSDQSIDGCSTSPDSSVNILQTAVSGELAASDGGTGGVGVPGQCVTLGPAPNFLPENIHNNLNEHNVPWRVGVDWTPIARTLVYGTVSKGFKAGSSPALGASNYDQLTPVTQEALLAYEVGVKSELFDRTVQVNVSAFHYDYTNKQQLGRLEDPVYGAVQTLLNIPKSKLDGAEFALTWKPVASLTLNGAATYLKSKVTSDLFNTGPYPLGPGEVINFRNEPFPFTPTWSVQYGARYDFNAFNGLRAFVGADGSYQSSASAAFGYEQATATGAPQLVVKSYALLNLTAGIGRPDNRWRVEIFGKNVTNTYYWNTVNYIADATTRFAGMPATYGARLILRY